jgi:hypothetical protein
MKVKELIDKLKKMDEDLEVVIKDCYDDSEFTSVFVKEDGVYNGAAAAVIEFLP